MDLPGLLYFQNGGIFTGSKDNARYIIKPIDTRFCVQSWQGPYCYDKSEIEDTQEFELNDSGRSAMMEWLTGKFKTLNK